MKLDALELKIPPVAVFLAFAGATWFAAAQCPWAHFALPGHRPLSVLLSAGGGILGFSGVASFLRARTTVHPERPHRATTLVRTGVYRISRNPMYAGLLCMLAGEAVALSTGWALLLLPAFVAYMNRFQIRPEERALRAKFGADYEAFAKSVRRWL